MRKLSCLITGIILGFIAAHFVNQTVEGRRFFDRVNRGTREFSDALASGYHDAESKVEEIFEDVEDSLRDLDNTQ
ncbi:MAG: hypothetical protein ACTHW3_02505 [Leucobacter sp.]